ncbi:cation-translocating P-type ATPase C-terminal domain-containing protein [Hymenobacter sp. H14-R3]|uniref:cation-translocating P-type ATPase C-terminal domain-containing protein n=1 Tax=Hymenobacter sp. H14-R3 TaxID=3046308 RepID=UPI0024B9CDAE|nr:cation-translocating P-type ATPase C-terminal domain-containing protein [Hymenobacter sp. H14-R3]MDJ0366504.1 cation-translocating P-type ATPase C-terminal domain-containing protein [Hymenobacter sp. H14-R3]
MINLVLLAIRPGRESIFCSGLLSNKPMLGAVALTLHLLIPYVPFCNELFSTQPLTAVELGGAVASVVFWVVEIQKLLAWRRGVAVGHCRWHQRSSQISRLL